MRGREHSTHTSLPSDILGAFHSFFSVKAFKSYAFPFCASATSTQPALNIEGFDFL